MKKSLIAILTLSMIFILTACNGIEGNGDVITRDYDLSDFDSINLSGAGDMIITVGDTESLSITTDSNIIEVITAEVRDNTLHIGQQNNTLIYNTTELTYEVTVTELTAIEISGSADLLASDIEGDDLSLEASGASEIEIEDVDVETLTVDISGSSDVTISGNANDLSLNISGSGDFDGEELGVETASIDISGSSEAKINASDAITGEISGSGDLLYSGSADVNVDTSGSGSVEDDN